MSVSFTDCSPSQEFFSKRLYELIPKQYGENPRRVHVVSYIEQVVKGDAEAKLRFYFQLVDHDSK